MSNWVYFAEKARAPVLWACTVPGCGGGQFINDQQGQADHAARFGHWPIPGRPLCVVAAVGT
jgi:hypothetical protein